MEPCYLDGEPRELFYRQGIGAIINQIIFWLERAAKNELIDLDQGWEPIRRDTVADFAVMDLHALHELIERKGGARFLPAEYVKVIQKTGIGP